MEKITLKIKGMRCNHCVQAVANAIKALPGVQFVNVCLEASDAVVKFDPAQCSVKKIKMAIENQGFEAG